MKRVVLVDDDPAIRKLLTILLELEGFEVEARGGLPILDVGATQPDIILLDVYIGSETSLDHLRNLRNSGQLSSSVRVIMTSGMDLRYECMDAGADAFLLKPYMPEELFHLIRELVPDQDTA